MYYLYLILTFVLAIWLSRKTEKKLLSFLITYFILAQPVLTSECTIDLPNMPFDLQPNRILLFILPIFILTDIISKENKQNNDKPLFEIFMFLCLISVGIALAWNYNRIEAKAFVVIPAQILLFIFLYFVLKKQSTEKLNESIIKAIVLVAFISSIIAIIQLLFNYSFMKICPPRYAFGDIVRSSGIFNSEYELGYILNFVIILCFIKYQKKKTFLYIVLPVLLLGLFSTFHRLNWIICFLVFPIYLFLFKKYKHTIVAIISLTMVAGVILALFFVNPNIFKKIEESKMVQDRFIEDTVRGRLKQFIVTADAMIRNPFGLGGYNNKTYYNLMKKHHMIKGSGEALVVHNGFLSFGIKYGLLGFFAFSGLILSMMIYFYKNFSLKRPDTAYPFFIVLIWAIANLSNSISLFSVYIVLIVAIVCGSSAGLLSEKKAAVKGFNEKI